jgi:hypothetical protein
VNQTRRATEERPHRERRRGTRQAVASGSLHPRRAGGLRHGVGSGTRKVGGCPRAPGGRERVQMARAATGMGMRGCNGASLRGATPPMPGTTGRLTKRSRAESSKGGGLDASPASQTQIARADRWRCAGRGRGEAEVQWACRSNTTREVIRGGRSPAC